MSILRTFLQFLQFLFRRKKFWLIPLVVIFGLVGALLVATEGTVMAPFVYALF